MSSSRRRSRRLVATLGSSSSRSRAGTLAGIFTSGKERGQDGVVITNNDRIVGRVLVLVPVRLAALVVVTGRRVVAINSL